MKNILDKRDRVVRLIQSNLGPKLGNEWSETSTSTVAFMACVGLFFTFLGLNEYEPVVVFGGEKNLKQWTYKMCFAKLTSHLLLLLTKLRHKEQIKKHV
jgi:hypothetical protein